jgi:hypothetical protein
MTGRLFALPALVLLAGCSAINPFRLEDQVALFHDDLRWARIPAAESAVAAEGRAQFVRRHARWGREVQIMDLEPEPTRMTGLVGLARARVTWTRTAETDVRETVIETRWRAGGGTNWYIDDERIVGGDPTLLVSPARRPTASATPVR